MPCSAKINFAQNYLSWKPFWFRKQNNKSSSLLKMLIVFRLHSCNNASFNCSESEAKFSNGKAGHLSLQNGKETIFFRFDFRWRRTITCFKDKWSSNCNAVLRFLATTELQNTFWETNFCQPHEKASGKSQLNASQHKTE